MAASDRRKVGVAQRNADGAGVKSRFAQAFCGLLAEVAEGGFQNFTVVCVVAKSLIMGN